MSFKSKTSAKMPNLLNKFSLHKNFKLFLEQKATKQTYLKMEHLY